MVRYILENTFVKFAGLIFRQIKGVPMGGNASPMIADLTLAIMELNFLKNTKNKDRARQAQFTCRYIDDILSFNCPTFLEIASEILS